MVLAVVDSAARVALIIEVRILANTADLKTQSPQQVSAGRGTRVARCCWCRWDFNVKKLLGRQACQLYHLASPRLLTCASCYFCWLPICHNPSLASPRLQTPLKQRRQKRKAIETRGSHGSGAIVRARGSLETCGAGPNISTNSSSHQPPVHGIGAEYRWR